jgi:diguanylate cyclase (GGDEF)-like protein/PAS domain S-box-containing protein
MVNMSANNIQNTLNTPPFGIGYFKLLVNSPNEAEDYMLLDVNPTFEELTGWSRESVLNKRVSEIFDNTNPGGFSWFSYFESVVRSGKTQETVQWIEAFKRYLKITVIPSDHTSVAVVIRHVSEESVSSNQKEETDPLPEDLDVIFNSTHDAISLVEYSNDEFLYIRNNAVHQWLTGFSNIRGLSPIELVGEEVGGTLLKYYEQCMSTGRPVSYEQKFNFAPGKRIWMTEVTPMFGKGGIRYLLCSSKDVSELKKVQGENEMLAQRLQSMFNRHAAVMLIIEPVSGRIVDANPAACEFYGYSKAELQSLLIRDINMLPPEEVEKNLLMTYEERQRSFTFPQRLKNGVVRLVDVYTCPISDGANTLLYSIIFDVTDREAYREELFKEKELILTTLRSIGDGMVTTDGSGIITSLNIVAQDITGWKNDEAKGRLFTDVFRLQNEETRQQVESPIQKVLGTGRIVGLANHTELVNRHGQCIPIADSAAPIKTEDGQTFGVVMVFRDVSNEKEHSKQIQFLSYHDPLTGLYNRRYIEETMNLLDTAENLPISVIMGDVNGLKITNDVFGHKVGDALLQNVARLLEKYCKEDDLIARLGGDEFIVLMPRASLKVAEAVIQRIKNTHIAIEGSNLSLSLSLGCASKDTMESNIQTVIQEAEEYMYHQKLLEGKSYRNAIINTLLATLYEKSNETEEHSKRIEKYCHSIGRKLQLSSKEMDELSLLALLHDIGKVSINPNILQKPGSLTLSEWDEMKRHPEIGYRIAQATPELAIVSDLILAHHERWDGKGYPRGLKGEEIPLACRILAVTDAFDAMTNDRVYRSAMSVKEAILELERNAGNQFDPKIANLLIETIMNEDDGTSKYA